MGFSLSPSVTVTEKDLTLYIPNVAVSIGATVGFAEWGPVEVVTTVSSEKTFVGVFGQPNDSNFKDWMTAFNFLAYSSNLKFIRVVDDAVALNSAAGVGPNASESQADFEFANNQVIINDIVFANSGSTITSATDFAAAGFVAGDIITITGSTSNDGSYTVTNVTTVVITVTEALADESMTTDATVATNVISSATADFITSGFVDAGSITVVGSTLNDGVFTINDVTDLNTLSVIETVVDDTAETMVVTQYAGAFDSTQSSPYLIKNGTDRDASEATIIATTNAVIAKYPGIYANDLSVSIADASSYSATDWANGTWKYVDFFDIPAEDNEIYVVVLYKGDVVETFVADKSKTSIDPVTAGTYYVKEVINRTSQYVWLIAENLYGGNDTVGYTNVQYEGALSGGLDGYVDTVSSDDERARGWDYLTDSETLDINLCMAGGASELAGKYMIENVCEWRKDCVGFVSPMSEDVVGSLTPVTDIVVTREVYGSSSYGFMDGNYKYQYDKYNDKFYWVPFNGDMAGLCAYTDSVEDPWWSPAGLNRGKVKNVAKLAFDPTKTNRDNLYRRAINPVVVFRGEGTVLFGDKTLQTKPSAFDRINVRRLFIVIEKAIATASKYALFEFNDQTTRQAFVNLVEPYLRDVKSRRGIYDFKVVCDETNNTPVVIDRNEFIGDIYIKPTRSINFIYLNFVAVPTGVEFEEVLLNQGNQ